MIRNKLLVPPGLPNQGNTCFMNASLQLLFRVPKFIRYITENGREIKLKIQNTEMTIQTVSVGERLICYLFDLYYKPCDSTIRRFARECQKEEIMSVGAQDDVFRFCFLLFGILCQYKDLKMFRTEFFYERECLNCGTITSRRSDIKYLEEVGVQFREKSLKYALEKKQYDDESDECGHCQSERGKLNQKTIYLPEYVLFRLDRGEEISRTFKVEDSLRLVQHLKEKNVRPPLFYYELVGFISFSGTTIEFGHVVTLLRGNSQVWYKCDDSRVYQMGYNKEEIEVLKGSKKGSQTGINQYTHDVCLMALYKISRVQGTERKGLDEVDIEFLPRNDQSIREVQEHFGVKKGENIPIDSSFLPQNESDRGGPSFPSQDEVDQVGGGGGFNNQNSGFNQGRTGFGGINAYSNPPQNEGLGGNMGVGSKPFDGSSGMQVREFGSQGRIDQNGVGGGGEDDFPDADEVISSNPSILDNPRRRTNPSAFQNNRSNFVPDHPPLQQQNQVEEFPSDADFPDVQDYQGLGSGNIIQIGGTSNLRNPSRYRQQNVGGSQNQVNRNPPAPSNGGQEDFPSEQEFVGVETDAFKIRMLQNSKGNIQSSLKHYRREYAKAKSQFANGDSYARTWVEYYDRYVKEKENELRNVKMRLGEDVDEVPESISSQPIRNVNPQPIRNVNLSQTPNRVKINKVATPKNQVKPGKSSDKNKPSAVPISVKKRVTTFEDLTNVQKRSLDDDDQKKKPVKKKTAGGQKPKYTLYCLNCSGKREFIFAKKGLNPGIFFYKCLTCNKTKSDRKDPKIRVEAKKKTKYKPVLTYCKKCHGDTFGQFLNQGHNPKFFFYKCTKCGEENISEIKPEKE